MDGSGPSGDTPTYFGSGMAEIRREGRSKISSGDVFALLSSRPETNPKRRSTNQKNQYNNVSDWIKDQEITFIQWINEHLKSSKHQMSISDLHTGLMDGLVLIELMKIVAPQSIQFIRYHKSPQLRLLRLENVQIALECMKREGIQLLNIEPADIVDGNLKLTLGLLQQLANHYPVNSMPQQSLLEKAMLAWFKAFLPECNITNFTTTWKTGVALTLLLNKLRPGVLADEALLGILAEEALPDPKTSLEITRQAMILAEKCFEIPQVVKPDEIACEDPNESALVSYLSYFCGPDSPGYQYMLDWIGKTMPSHTIINFSTDWFDGSALCLLLNVFLSDIVAKDNTLSPEESVTYAMRAADKELGIPSILTPEEFICADTEELLRMAYITQFIHLKPKTPSFNEIELPVITASSGEETVAPTSSIIEFPVTSSGEETVAPTSSIINSFEFPITSIGEETVTPISSNINSFEPVLVNTISCTHSPEIMQEFPEKFELKVHKHASFEDESGVHEVEREKANREKQRSELHQLFAAAEIDFDLILKEIDEIGMTADKAPPVLHQNSGAHLAVTKDTTTNVHSAELELDFDFSSDASETSSCANNAPIHEQPHSPSFDSKNQQHSDDKHEDEEEIIEVSYMAESRSQLSTTTSPEPISEHSNISSTSQSQSPSLSPIPLQENTREAKAASLSFPSKCKVEGHGLTYGVVNRPNSFIVDCSNAGRGRLEVIIEAPNGDNLEANGEQIQNNVFKITFVPLSVDTHKISIMFSEEHVPNSPYLCQVSDPNACIVSGIGFSSAVVGKEIEFKVDTNKAGPGSLQAKLNGSNEVSQFQLISCLDGICTYRFMVQDPGDYSIDITWAGEHIKGSPFRFTVPDPICFRPDACVIVDDVQARYKVGDDVTFRVDTHKAGFGELKAMFVTARGESVCNVTIDNKGVYTVSVQPTEVGKHHIVLQYGGEELPQSPLQVTVNNAKLLVFDSAVLTQPLYVNKFITLPVNTTNCGDGVLTVKVNTPHGINNAQIHHDCNHNYTVTYTPTSVGNYSFELYYDDHPCLSKPLMFSVLSLPSIDNITLTKPIKSQYHLNKTVDFHVHAPSCDPSQLKISAFGIKTGLSDPQPSIVSKDNEHYTAQFRANKCDDFKISVTYNKMDVKGSPFIISVCSPPRASKVSMFDPVIPLKADQPIELVFDTSQAGKGELIASSVNSKGKPMPVNVEQVSDGMYHVAFIPQKSDTFMVTVFYANKHINGSPFRVLYKQQVKVPPVCIYFEPDPYVQGLMGAAVYGRNSGRQEATVVQYQRSKYQVSFYPNQPDLFDLHVYWFDQEIEGSPFEIDLLGMENESSSSLVDCAPYSTEDKIGMLAATVVGRMVGPVPVRVSTEDDSCSVAFSVQRNDIFDINIFWNGKPLGGMPVHLAL